MSKTTALIAIFTSVLLMTACGSQAEKQGYYEYNVSFNEPLSEETDYYEAGAADELTVKSVTYSQLSYGAFNTDDLFGESETANAE